MWWSLQARLSRFLFMGLGPVSQVPSEPLRFLCHFRLEEFQRYFGIFRGTRLSQSWRSNRFRRAVVRLHQDVACSLHSPFRFLTMSTTLIHLSIAVGA